MVDDRNQNINPDVPSLKEIRLRLGLTQEEFGSALGMAANTISRHERGQNKIRFSVSQIKRLKELLEQGGMSIDDLPDDID
jgi:transcriptional regulator with XRE-family HTH domain